MNTNNMINASTEIYTLTNLDDFNAKHLAEKHTPKAKRKLYNINIRKEYQLIKAKKSKLSKWERDEVVRQFLMVHRYD